MKFRRKKRYHHTRSAGKMKGDWIIGIHENCMVTVINEGCVEEAPGVPFAFSLIDTQDLADKEDKLTVVRTVGELGRFFTAEVINGSATETIQFSEIFTFHEGIYVAGADGQVPTAEVIELDPSTAQDCQLDTWMWLRHTSVMISASLPAAQTVPVVVAGQFLDGSDIGAHIDLRVKRKLEHGQELIYAAKMTNSFLVGKPASLTQTSFATLNGHLRHYCKF